jgi:sugar lactone lactonase YvrE
VAPDGSVATPGGRSSTGSTDGTGTQARFGAPRGVAVDAQGNVHVADHHNGTLRKVSPAGGVSTFVGTAALGKLPADGVGPDAHLFFPSGLAFDAAGNLLVVEAGVGSNFGFDPGAVRRVTPQAVASVVFNSGGFGNEFDLLCARQDVPVNDVAADASGTLYFVHPDRPIVCKFTAQGRFVLVAGDPAERGSADGPARDARFKAPSHLVFDAAGNLYVTDAGNHTVRRISPQGVVSTVAGLAGQAGDADGVGAAARFSTPGDLAVAPDGSVYVADIRNRAVRRLAPDGAVTTFIRAGGTATLAEPTALAIGPGGRLLYIADGTQNVLWRAPLP